MHSTLTEHARCLYGDEYRPRVERCAQDSEGDFYFIERLTLAGAEEIVAMMRELCPELADGLLPVWVRNLAYRLALLQRPDDPVLLREAAHSLFLHGPDWDEIAVDLEARAAVLDGGERYLHRP